MARCSSVRPIPRSNFGQNDLPRCDCGYSVGHRDGDPWSLGQMQLSRQRMSDSSTDHREGEVEVEDLACQKPSEATDVLGNSEWQKD